MTVLMAYGIILFIFCIALRIKNKPQNAEKRREQKRFKTRFFIEKFVYA
jgi:hypothetical protein